MHGSIGFLNDQILVRDTTGGLSCDEAFVRFLLAFRERFDRVVLFSRVQPDTVDEALSVRVEGDGVEVAELPYYPRISSLFSSPLRYWPAVDRALDPIASLDALWLNTGHPVSVRALWRLRGRERPALCAALRGNYEQDAAIREGGAARAAALAQTAMMHVFARLARARDVPVLAYGDAAVARATALGMRALAFETTLLDAETIASPPAPEPSLQVDLITVCRVVREKGLDRLLDALPGLRGAGGAPATLAIIGDGPQREALRAQAGALGLGGRVQFRGFVAHGPALMQQLRSAEVFVLPSRTEGVPATVLEAMAMRVPVVATAIGGLPSLLADERGVLVSAEEVGLVARLAAALQQVLDDAVQRERLAATAFAHVAELTLQGQVDRVVGLLDLGRA